MSSADLVALVRKAAADSLNAQAEAAQKATRALAPRDTGALVASIKVSDATAGSLVSQVYSDADHALYQHEALDLRHETGRSKFMEAAVIEQKAAIAAAGAKAARKALG